MDKELLMLYGARHAVLETIDNGGWAFEKRLDDGTRQRADWNDICNYLTDMINKYEAKNEEAE